jgi:hypothetical protein
MSSYIDSFAHDLFPDKRSMVAFSQIGHPLLAMMEQRSHNSPGRKYGYPAFIQGPIAMAPTRAEVQEIADQPDDVANFDGEEFLVPYFPYKAGFNISELDYATTEGSGGVPDGAYLEKFAVSMREIFENLGARKEAHFVSPPGRSLALSTANGGTTTLNTGVIRLADKTLATRFRKHQIIQASTSAGSSSAHSLLDSGSRAYIRYIDYDAGELYVSSTSGGSVGHSGWNTAASTSAIYIFGLGDFQGGASPTLLAKGYQDWNPSSWSTTIDSAGNFFAVNRGNDQRLAGWRLPSDLVSGEQLDTVIENCLDHVSTFYGGTGEFVFPMSKKRWTSLSRIAKARGYRMLDGKGAFMGYRYIEIIHGDMTAKIVAVPQFQQDDLFCMDMKDDGWVERHLGQGLKVLNGDGLKMLRKTATDDYEVRIRDFYHNATNRIWRQGRADISGVSL